MADVVTSSNNSWGAWDQMASIVNSCYTNNYSDSEVVIQLFEEKVNKQVFASNQNAATTPEELIGRITGEHVEKHVDEVLDESFKTRMWTAFESLGGALLSLALIVAFVAIVVIWFMIEGAILTSWLPAAVVLGLFFTSIIVPAIFIEEILTSFFQNIIDLCDYIEKICNESDAYDSTKVELEKIKNELIPLQKYETIEDLFQPAINFVQNNSFNQHLFLNWIKNPSTVHGYDGCDDIRQYFKNTFSSFIIAKGLFSGELLPEIFHKISNIYMYLKVREQVISSERTLPVNPWTQQPNKYRVEVADGLEQKLYHSIEEKLYTLPEEEQKEYQAKFQNGWQALYGIYRPPVLASANIGNDTDSDLPDFSFNREQFQLDRNEFILENKEQILKEEVESFIKEFLKGFEDKEFQGFLRGCFQELAKKRSHLSFLDEIQLHTFFRTFLAKYAGNAADRELIIKSGELLFLHEAEQLYMGTISEQEYQKNREFRRFLQRCFFEFPSIVDKEKVLSRESGGFLQPVFEELSKVFYEEYKVEDSEKTTYANYREQLPEYKKFCDFFRGCIEKVANFVGGEQFFGDREFQKFLPVFLQAYAGNADDRRLLVAGGEGPFLQEIFMLFGCNANERRECLQNRPYEQALQVFVRECAKSYGEEHVLKNPKFHQRLSMFLQKHVENNNDKLSFPMLSSRDCEGGLLYQFIAEYKKPVQAQAERKFAANLPLQKNKIIDSESESDWMRCSFSSESVSESESESESESSSESD